ncbi:MAG: hypothetical protein LKJ69_10685 [Lactobacillus sp.]|jgi:hypothetical protein|nr:hypothetical protein [Lactobacillus sp.]
MATVNNQILRIYSQHADDPKAQTMRSYTGLVAKPVPAQLYGLAELVNSFDGDSLVKLTLTYVDTFTAEE